MARAQLLHVAACDVLERDPQCICRDRHAPERVAQLERECVAIERAPLQQVLSDVGEHLPRLLGQAGGCVEQSLLLREVPPDGPACFRLVLRQRRGVRGRATHAYVTRGSAFAYARSVSRFTSTNTAERKSTDPWIAG